LRLCRDEFDDEGAFSLLLLLLVLAEVDGALLLLLVEVPACGCFTRGMLLTPASRQKACGNYY
jgi:hypothetical protein